MAETTLETPVAASIPPAEPSPADAPPPRTRRWVRRTVLVTTAALVMVVGWSYVHALAAPGTDGVDVRSVEWLRDHGGNGLVSTIERWWYAHHPPKKGGPPPAVLTRPVAAPPTAPSSPRAPAVSIEPPPHRLPPPTPIRPLASPATPGEGVWHPAGRLVRGVPAVYATALRPDPVHTSLATGVAWMDPTLLRVAMFAGVQQPGGRWSNEAPVPVADRASLVATFNSGFKLPASRGGYYAEGRIVRPLVNGAASLVIDTSGRPTVGAWGRDDQMSPSVASVRQNLALIVDNGAAVAGLDQNIRGLWGATLGNTLFVWRSGVGVTADGALVYAAGNGLSVSSLARVLAAAGAVRGMELDINSEWTHFFSYDSPDAAQPATVVGTKLVPDMRASPNLYLEGESRDFFALFAR